MIKVLLVMRNLTLLIVCFIVIFLKNSLLGMVQQSKPVVLDFFDILPLFQTHLSHLLSQIQKRNSNFLGLQIT